MKIIEIIMARREHLQWNFSEYTGADTSSRCARSTSTRRRRRPLRCLLCERTSETLDIRGLGLDAGADALSVDSELCLSVGLESLDLPSWSTSRALSPSASSSAMHRMGSSQSVGRLGLGGGESDAGRPKKVPPPRLPPPNLSSAQLQQQCNNSTAIPKVGSSSQLNNNAIASSM